MDEYPLSPTILPDSAWQVPRSASSCPFDVALLHQLLKRCAFVNCSNAVHSCASPPVSTKTKATGLPLPSHLTCILVENPPRLRPNASPSWPIEPPFCGSPFLHRRRFDERVQRCRLHNGLSTGPHPAYLPGAVALQAFGPRCQPYASGTSARRLSWKSHSVRAGPPTVLQS